MQQPTAIDYAHVSGPMSRTSCPSKYVRAYCRNDHEDIVSLELPNHCPFRRNLTEREDDHSNKRNPCGDIDQGSAML